MAAYVRHHENGTRRNYHSTGPFTSVRQAAL